MTTLVVPPTFTLAVPAPAPTSFSFYQGNDVGTASDVATTALPTQLVFDTTAAGAVPSDAKSVVVVTSATPTSASTPTESAAAPSNQSKKTTLPIAAIILSLVAVAALLAFCLFLWYRKRARRRGHGHGRAGSEEYGSAPPATDVLRKLGTNYEKSADPFSDAHAAPPSDPFADPTPHHTRSGSDSFLNMGNPRAPFTHAPSASTGSSASSKARKREMEEARKRDMSALNNLVRALDQKDRQAQVEGRDRKSLPPVELFKAALVR